LIPERELDCALPLISKDNLSSSKSRITVMTSPGWKEEMLPLVEPLLYKYPGGNVGRRQEARNSVNQEQSLETLTMHTTTPPPPTGPPHSHTPRTEWHTRSFRSAKRLPSVGSPTNRDAPSRQVSKSNGLPTLSRSHTVVGSRHKPSRAVIAGGGTGGANSNGCGCSSTAPQAGAHHKGNITQPCAPV
jgi:hypothetical protein